MAYDDVPEAELMGLLPTLFKFSKSSLLTFFFLGRIAYLQTNHSAMTSSFCKECLWDLYKIFKKCSRKMDGTTAMHL